MNEKCLKGIKNKEEIQERREEKANEGNQNRLQAKTAQIYINFEIFLFFLIPTFKFLKTAVQIEFVLEDYRLCPE